ncbi:MAG: GDSL-type esterase/lipase family protein [Rikenellaceae bacterium]|nr:GDSL-type esterase/lipase family protein [Rikenellaceae bacterium]
MKQKDNKLEQVPRLLALVLAMLSGLSLAGGFSVGGWDARPVRLYADLTKGLFVTEEEVPDDSYLWAQIEMPDPLPEGAWEPHSEVPDVAPAAENRTGQQSAAEAVPVEKSAMESVAALESRTDPAGVQMHAVPIEDFSENRDALSFFFSALDRRQELDRPVRIAFLGDSFVEGDILTSNLREYLQERFGGRGVGFVPLAAIDRYRNTVNIEHEGWRIQNSLYRDQKANYLLGGQTFFPASGEAWVSIRTTDQRDHAKSFDTASLLYSADSAATVYYRLGAAQEQQTSLRDDGSLQLLVTHRKDMRSVNFRIQAGEGFTGYGLFLNDETGVYVDNYSLRSSSGVQLLRVGPNLLQRMSRMIPYDLVILQYGMNVMEADRREYNTYTEQMIRVVNRIREAMPQASILIFGVGDRNFRNEDGDMVTRPGVISLIEAQRRIAQESGVAFWNTYLAMGGRNSMGSFVDHTPALANKDYTHINYLGGRRIGLAFGQALTEAQSRYE